VPRTVSLIWSHAPLAQRMARAQAFLERSTISRATMSGAKMMLSTAVQDTVAMTSGERILPARVPGIHRHVQKAP